jgi:hypothetical protein
MNDATCADPSNAGCYSPHAETSGVLSDNTSASVILKNGAVVGVAGADSLAARARASRITATDTALYTFNGGHGVQLQDNATFDGANTTIFSATGDGVQFLAGTAGTPTNQFGLNGGTMTAGRDVFHAGTSAAASGNATLTGVTATGTNVMRTINAGSRLDVTASSASSLAGDILADTGTANLTLKSSHWQGAAFNAANVTLDAPSIWTMTASLTVSADVTNAGLITYVEPTGDPKLLPSYKTLTVAQSYAGQGGVIALSTYFGADSSPSDRIVIGNGGTATGTTTLRITNTTGLGAMTTANGILVVEAVGSATTDANAFVLAGGSITENGYLYELFRGGVNGNAPQSWFLRGRSDPSGPLPGGTGATAIPTLEHHMLALLAALLGGMAWTARRRTVSK